MQHLKLETLITEAAGFPALTTYLEANFTGPGCEFPELLLTKAEDSPFPLRQWLESLVLFEQWLITGGLTLPIANQIGYIACSAESGSAYATLTQLPVQVNEMLEHYGCDDAEPVHPSSSPLD
jgi:hypothetical protein